MLLQVCPNGARTPDEHPALAADPLVVADDVAGAVQAGARSVHLHPKDAEGRDSLEAEDVEAWLHAFRRACPGVELGVTTGAWSVPDPAERYALISDWRDLPDLPELASVNWHEEGAEQVADLLLSRGIRVEAGIWTPGAASQWAASPLAVRCTRVLVEVQDIPAAEVPEEAGAILEAVRAARPEASILLHGEERSAWPAFEIAHRLRVDTRIGLEDTLVLHDGSPATSNTQLVDHCAPLIRC